MNVRFGNNMELGSAYLLDHQDNEASLRNIVGLNSLRILEYLAYICVR